MNIHRRDFLTSIAGIATAAISPNLLAQDSEGTTDVILAFDGNKGGKKWTRHFDLQKELEDITQTPAHFTIYCSGSYFFPNGSGKSNIGWGGTAADIEERFSYHQKGIDLGHDIGSHAIGHLQGGDWSYNRWHDELAKFDEVVAENLIGKDGNPHKCVGFRAPYLEWNNNMMKALDDLDYVYDVSPPGEDIRKIGDLIVVELPMWKFPGHSKQILSMDYNWMVSHVTNAQLRSSLESESKRRNPLIISMHGSEYKAGVYGDPYINDVEEFMIRGAKEGRFRFPSMIEYIEKFPGSPPRTTLI
jgi:peptidoglycan/xylan/chitin deacetylase (PgdA/CDA1 family)